MENKKKFSIKKFITVQDICEIAIFVALANVLDAFGQIRIGENGGSIGLSMIPLFFIAYRHGFIKSIFASVVFGLVACSIDGFWQSYWADYLLAYGSICIAGLFSKLVLPTDKNLTVDNYIYMVISLIIVFVLRYFWHVVSGMIYYATPLEGSLTYNILYVGPTFVIDLIVLIILLAPLYRLNKVFKRR